MFTFSQVGDAIEVRHQHEVVRVEPWGTDSVRVRAARGSLPATDVGALQERPDSAVAASISVAGQTATLTNGDLTVEITNAELEWPTPPGLRFLRTSTGGSYWPNSGSTSGGRALASTTATGAASGEIHQEFRAYPDERLYGMGERTHGRLNHKGLALDLIHRNAEVSIPFVLSSRGYGLLWNNPAVGRVEFADNVTRWTAAQARGDRLLHHHRVSGADPVARR